MMLIIVYSMFQTGRLFCSAHFLCVTKEEGLDWRYFFCWVPAFEVALLYQRGERESNVLLITFKQIPLSLQ